MATVRVHMEVSIEIVVDDSPTVTLDEWRASIESRSIERIKGIKPDMEFHGVKSVTASMAQKGQR